MTNIQLNNTGNHDQPEYADNIIFDISNHTADSVDDDLVKDESETAPVQQESWI